MSKLVRLSALLTYFQQGQQMVKGWKMLIVIITFWQINIDPENHHFLMETSLPTPTTARVYVNLPEGIPGFVEIDGIYIYIVEIDMV